MKSLEEFQEAGQELYEGLTNGAFAGEVQNLGQCRFWSHLDGVAVVSLVQPPYENRENMRWFIESLGMGIAVSRGEKLAPIFSDEVDVLLGAVLLPLRKKQAVDSMTRAISETGKARRSGRLGALPTNLQACIDAVEAEEKARDTAFYIDNQYARYQVLEPNLSGVEV